MIIITTNTFNFIKPKVTIHNQKQSPLHSKLTTHHQIILLTKLPPFNTHLITIINHKQYFQNGKKVIKKGTKKWIADF